MSYINPLDLMNKVKSSSNTRSDFEKDMITKVKNFLIRGKFPTKNLDLKLKNLYIKKDESQKGVYSAGYNSTNNTLVYSDNRDLAHELLHVSSSSSESKATGITVFDAGNKLNVGLDEGLTDMLSLMVDKNSNCSNVFEYICAEILSKMFGYQMLYGYFNNSFQEFINSFDKSVQGDILELLENIDEYHFHSDRILTGKYTVVDLEEISNITYSVLDDFFNIAEAIGYDKNELSKYINVLIHMPKHQEMKKVIGLYDIDLDELSRGFEM